MSVALKTTSRINAANQIWRSLQRNQAFVGGSWIDSASGKTITVTDPATGAVLGVVPSLDSAAMQTAIGAARAAFPAWKSLLPRRRAECLLRWHALILEHRSELAALMTTEQGKPLEDAAGEIDYAASFILWFAEEANRIYGEMIPSHLPSSKMMVQREPLGVVGLVTPWNFPSAMLARKAAAALAAGCTVVSVPSTQTPYSALALALLAEKAGMPPGVFSVLTGDPSELVGELCRHEDVRGLSFTGSTEIGRLLYASCAPTIKRIALELGGHAPFIVFPDAPLDEAARAAVQAKYQTSGQDCLAANRIFVHRDIYEPFVARFSELAAALRVGNGFEPGIELGPLMNARAVEKCESHIADAVAKGARLISGGHRLPLGELFFAPTVLADVTADMAIMREETFGPVAAILPFTDEDAVVEAANDTEYGLVAYVFTRDVSRCHRMADRLEYGMVALNTMKLTGAPIPFGGIKQSGIGREGSRHALDDFTVLKYVCLAV